MNMNVCRLMLPLLLLAASTASAATLEEAQKLYRSADYTQARTAFLALAQNDADTSVAVSCRLSAAACLLYSKSYGAFEGEAQALLREPSSLAAAQTFMLKKYLAIGYFYQKKFAPAREAFLALKDSAADTSQLASVQGLAARCLFETKSYGPFIKDAQALLAQNPPLTHGEAASLEDALVKALVAQKQYAEARQAFLTMAQQSADATQAATNRMRAAICLFHLKAFDDFAAEGQAILNQPTGLKSSDIVILKSYLSGILFRKKQYGAARDAFLSMAQNDANTSHSASARSMAARCLHESHAYDAFIPEAQGILAQHLPLKTEEAAALKNALVAALSAKKQYSEARQILLAMARESTDATRAVVARISAATCLFYANEFDDFLVEGQSLLSQLSGLKSPQIFTLKQYLAVALFRKRQFNPAREALLALAQSDDDATRTASVRALAARCLFESNSHDAFIKEAQGFLAQHPPLRAPEASSLQDSLAMALSYRKDYGESRKIYQSMAENGDNTTQALHARVLATNSLFTSGTYSDFVREGEGLLRRYPEQAGSADLLRLKSKLAEVPGEQRGDWEESAKRLVALVTPDLPGDLPSLMRLHVARAYMKATTQQTSQSEKAAQLRGEGLRWATEARETQKEFLRTQRPDLARSVDHRNLELETYLMAGDMTSLAKAAQALASEAPNSSRLWGAGMVWLGISRVYSNPSDLAGAAKAMDAVTEAGITDDSWENNVPAKAAFWRAIIAQQQGDTKRLAEMVRLMREQPDNEDKKAALERFAGADKPAQ